jgi:hypothetical protein
MARLNCLMVREERRNSRRENLFEVPRHTSVLSKRYAKPPRSEVHGPQIRCYPNRYRTPHLKCTFRNAISIVLHHDADITTVFIANETLLTQYLA